MFISKLFYNGKLNSLTETEFAVDSELIIFNGWNLDLHLSEVCVRWFFLTWFPKNSPNNFWANIFLRVICHILGQFLGIS